MSLQKIVNNETDQDKVYAIEFSMLRQTFHLTTRPRQIICRGRRKQCHDTAFIVNNEI